MQNYQPHKNNPYILPHELYMRMIYLVRDYERLKKERTEIILSSPVHSGGSTKNTGNPTEVKALKLAVISGECEAVEKALQQVPSEYRKGIINNICQRKKFPIDADNSTYSRWKSRFLYDIAKKLNFI